MSTTIKHSDIKVGDTIEIIEHRTMKVAYINHAGVPITTGGVPIRRASADSDTFEIEFKLVDRPLNIPTKTGTVLHVTSDLSDDIGLWFLYDGTPSRGRKFWVSQRGNRKTTEEFERFIRSVSSRRFEVVL